MSFGIQIRPKHLSRSCDYFYCEPMTHPASHTKKLKTFLKPYFNFTHDSAFRAKNLAALGIEPPRNQAGLPVAFPYRFSLQHPAIQWEYGMKLDSVRFGKSGESADHHGEDICFAKTRQQVREKISVSKQNIFSQ